MVQASYKPTSYKPKKVAIRYMPKRPLKPEDYAPKPSCLPKDWRGRIFKEVKDAKSIKH